MLSKEPLDPVEPGGADRDRTDDLRLAKPALSQLSYSPREKQLVGLGRFELPTSRLSGVRSNQLSYRPDCDRQVLESISVPEIRVDSLETEQRKSGQRLT